MLTRDALVQLRKGQLQHFYIRRPGNGCLEPDDAYHDHIRDLARKVRQLDGGAVFIPCWETDRYHFCLSNGQEIEPQRRLEFFMIFDTPFLTIAVSESLVQAN